MIPGDEKNMISPRIPPGRLARLTDFLALHPSTIGVLAMVVLVVMGERMAERFLSIYIPKEI